MLTNSMSPVLLIWCWRQAILTAIHHHATQTVPAGHFKCSNIKLTPRYFTTHAVNGSGPVRVSPSTFLQRQNVALSVHVTTTISVCYYSNQPMLLQQLAYITTAVSLLIQQSAYVTTAISPCYYSN